MQTAGWNGFRAWLHRVPVDDPIDRKNAPFMQMVLMFFGIYMPLNLYYYVVHLGIVDPDPVLNALNVITDLLVVATAWTGVWLIRRGRLHLAVTLFLATVLVSLALWFAWRGMNGIVIDTTFPVLSLIISGLVLGRRALWKVLAALVAGIVLGVLSDAYRNHIGIGSLPGASWMLPTVMLYLMITVILDRTIRTLRSSLEESERRRIALAETNRRLQEEMLERERAQARLVHAQKLEAVGRVASGVAHDFDNVLNVVLGYATRRDYIADRGAPALVDALEGVEVAARRALAISRKLLNFSRQDVARPEVFDAVAALKDLQPMLRQLFDDDVRLRFEVANEALPVRMDRGQFELVTLNIAANARDAMPNGGLFVVSARRAEGAATLELDLSDSGCGMPESVRAQIFEPFYTTKPVGRGTGLGLAVVHDLLEAADGSISVESASDRGTAFRIRLPLMAPA